MSIKQFLKARIEKIPYSIGSLLALVPYRFRLGYNYSMFNELINSDIVDDYKYTITHFSKIFEFAKYNYPFYTDFYKKAGVLDLEIKSITDIQKIPIIKKEDIRKYFDEFNGAMLLNTGGTSGEPFSFYVDKNAFAREWAHMHYIWGQKGYKYTDLKVTLRGQDLGQDNIKYNSIHNEFIINTYKNAWF